MAWRGAGGVARQMEQAGRAPETWRCATPDPNVARGPRERDVERFPLLRLSPILAGRDNGVDV